MTGESHTGAGPKAGDAGQVSARPRLTASVKEGLKWFSVLADSWREADGDESFADDPQAIKDMGAAKDFIKRGGLSTRRTTRPDGTASGPAQASAVAHLAVREGEAQK